MAPDRSKGRGWFRGPSPRTVLLLCSDGLVERRAPDIDDSVRSLAGLGMPADGSPTTCSRPA